MEMCGPPYKPPEKEPPESLNGSLGEPQSRSRLLGEKKFTKELSTGWGGGAL
jgi:hypothetical protein